MKRENKISYMLLATSNQDLFREPDFNLNDFEKGNFDLIINFLQVNSIHIKVLG